MEVIETGSILGRGSFCTVKSVRALRQNEDEGDVYFKAMKLKAADLESYAIKQVRKDLSLKGYRAALRDLEHEAKILVNLSHPNIVKMYGVGVELKTNNNTLLIERICWSLEHQIRTWRNRRNLFSPSCGHIFTITRNISHLWKERMTIAYQFAVVMTYLHRQRIVFRDLKPSNCGFDNYGNFKLFDFGLATKLDEGQRVGLDEYKLTGNTGSQKYMAPEVARCKPYGTSSDVYSFAIIMWEIFSLKQAFKGETRASHARKVYGHRNFRPKLSPFWPRDLTDLIKECWSVNAKVRPSFNKIQYLLNAMTAKCN